MHAFANSAHTLALTQSQRNSGQIRKNIRRIWVRAPVWMKRFPRPFTSPSPSSPKPGAKNEEKDYNRRDRGIKREARDVLRASAGMQGSKSPGKRRTAGTDPG